VREAAYGEGGFGDPREEMICVKIDGCDPSRRSQNSGPFKSTREIAVSGTLHDVWVF
jgi:hypothetical protein